MACLPSPPPAYTRSARAGRRGSEWEGQGPLGCVHAARGEETARLTERGVVSAGHGQRHFFRPHAESPSHGSETCKQGWGRLADRQSLGV